MARRLAGVKELWFSRMLSFAFATEAASGVHYRTMAKERLRQVRSRRAGVADRVRIRARGVARNHRGDARAKHVCRRHVAQNAQHRSCPGSSGSTAEFTDTPANTSADGSRTGIRMESSARFTTIGWRRFIATRASRSWSCSRAGPSRSSRGFLPDDVATGELAARHFLERGFRHFAYFGASWMLWSREREAGFRGEIEQHVPGPDGIGPEPTDRLGRFTVDQLRVGRRFRCRGVRRIQRAAGRGDGRVAPLASHGRWRCSWPTICGDLNCCRRPARVGPARSRRHRHPGRGRRGTALRNRASAAVEHPHRRRADRTGRGFAAGPIAAQEGQDPGEFRESRRSKWSRGNPPMFWRWMIPMWPRRCGTSASTR